MYTVYIRLTIHKSHNCLQGFYYLYNNHIPALKLHWETSREILHKFVFLLFVLLFKTKNNS